MQTLAPRKGLHLQMKNKTSSSHGTSSDIIQIPNFRLLVVKKIQPQVTETEKIVYFPENK